MITSEQARLINLGLLIKKFERLHERAESDGGRAIYKSQVINYQREYFDLRFEMNREQLENKYIDYASDTGLEIEEIQNDISLGSQRFFDYCTEMCFENV